VEDLVLIDCGGSLHGYNSDITRTFALHESTISEEHLTIWYAVQEAQAAAAKAATNGTVTSAVDAAARTVIAKAGYGKHFTHRLGHGISSLLMRRTL
jgi:Xaa-Pro aminopeptidase